MNTILIAATAAVAMLAGGAALADDKLATSKHCMECHDGKEKNGPTYKEIAKLYKGTPGAEKKIAEKLVKGGAEHWGPNVMPSAAARGVKISDAEAKQLAQWVLSQ
jgi:cytochrome c